MFRFFFLRNFLLKNYTNPAIIMIVEKPESSLEFKICFPLAEEGLFCDAGALSGGRKCALYFDVSVSGQTYCLLEQILESYEREG